MPKHRLSWPLAMCLVGAGACDGADNPSTDSAASGDASATGATGPAEGSGSASSDGADSATTAMGSMDSGTVGPLSESGDTTPGTDSGPAGACVPPSVPFSAQASVSLDPSAMSCSVAEGTGVDPQLVLDVRNTGLLDLAAMGLSIQTASSGTYINPTNIVGISPDVPLSLAATVDADGSPVTIEIEISSTGPVLFAQVIYGG